MNGVSEEMSESTSLSAKRGSRASVVAPLLHAPPKAKPHHYTAACLPTERDGGGTWRGVGATRPNPSGSTFMGGARVANVRFPLLLSSSHPYA
jgi:hypothetical protein